MTLSNETREKLEIVPFKHSNSNHVVISNLLVRSIQGMNLYEKRLVMAAISAMRGKPQGVKISAEDFAETYHLENINNVYSCLKSTVEALRTRYITMREELKEGRKTFIKTTKFNLLDYIAYADDMGYVELQFTATMEPYLCRLMARFTQYQLKQAADLRSIYSWRLLELLEQMKKKSGNGWLEIGLDEFLDIMEAKETHKKNFGAVRQKILTPSIAELSKKDGWCIEYEPIKQGRKVVTLRFTYTKNRQADMFTSQKKPVSKKEVKECQDKLRQIGFLGGIIPDVSAKNS